MSESMREDVHVVSINAGAGGFAMLQTFKDLFETVSSVVNMADDGGSSGVLRDELGVLPPGDIRQSLVALSEASTDVREWFTHRYSDGPEKGHTRGNLLLSRLQVAYDGDFERAVEELSAKLRVRGQVIPVTKDNATLELRWPDDEGGSAEVVRGEYKIGHLDFKGRTKPVMSLNPEVTLNPRAEAAIGAADVVVIAPGNLYGSTAPALLVKGMRETLQQTEATIIYVCNLVTKPGQTDGFRVHDYAREVNRFIGAEVLNKVLFNTAEPAPALRDQYMRENEFLVQACHRTLYSESYDVVGLDLIDRAPVITQAGDAIAHSRSLIRHNAGAVADYIQKLLRRY